MTENQQPTSKTYDLTPEALQRVVEQAVRLEITARERRVPVGISVRHVHLSREHVVALFGEGYQLTPRNPLSQPGQFACEETLTVEGPKGSIPRVRILGPERKATQVELAFSDCRTVGIDAPVRASGHTEGTPGCVLRAENGNTVTLQQGVIIADRHLHMSTAEAAAFGLHDGERIRIAVDGPKAGVLGNVTVRAGDAYALDFHIDVDDANAFLLKQGQEVTVL